MKKIIIVIIIFFFIGMIWGGLSYPNQLDLLNLIVLSITLIALIFYAYYTYLLSRDALTLSASFALKPLPDDSYHFAFIIKNYSKVSLQCWCNLNITIYGNSIPLSGFYNGESSFDVQPFGNVMGHFNIKDILTKAGHNLEQIKKETTSTNIKEQFYLDIEFWYNSIGTKLKIKNPKQPHYFDFIREIMVTDF